MKLLFVDCETTGLNPDRNAIHQLSGLVVIDGVVKSEFNLNMQPHEGAEIVEEALKCSGTTAQMLSQYPPPYIVYQQFVTMLSHWVNKFDKTDKFFLIGYNNAGFDNQFLRAWFAKNGDKYFGSWFWSNCIDVMILATEYLAHQRHLMTDFKLKTVAAACGIAVEEERLHGAAYDIQLTKQIYDCITSKIQVESKIQ